MLSMGDSLKGFDLERFKELAQRAKANTHSSADLEEAKYECTTCKDEEGYFIKVEEEMMVRGVLEKVLMDKWRTCSCLEKKRIAKLIKSSSITQEFRSKTFSNFDWNVHEIIKEAHKAAFEYVKKFQTVRNTRNNSVALVGRSGSGKTHLLMAVSNNLLAKGIGVVYFPWAEGFNELKNDFDKLEERISRLQKVDVLFIDDMWKGREKPTNFQIEQTYAIVNYRYMNNLPILISSERSFEEMCEYDEAIGSRLKEMSKGNTVTIKGGIELNYRLKGD